MKPAPYDTATDVLNAHILTTLLYYDIFNYPLKAEEVYRFLGTNHVDKELIRAGLLELTERKKIFQFGDLFSVRNSAMLAARRIQGNAEAEKIMPLARKQARLIVRFPFVRAVMSSGSLSKGYMDEKSDLDFFIITKPGRLWITRTLLVLYKRLFLFNSHKYFCVNYFIDHDHLEIEEKNLFTATELATVLPLQGGVYYDQLQKNNPWLKSFFPNYQPRSIEDVPTENPGWMKRLTEKCIDLFGGNLLEKFCQHLTNRRWKKLYRGSYTAGDFEVAFKTKSYASKNHPNHYQRKVMDMHKKKLEEFAVTLAHHE